MKLWKCAAVYCAISEMMRRPQRRLICKWRTERERRKRESEKEREKEEEEGGGISSTGVN